MTSRTDRRHEVLHHTADRRSAQSAGYHQRPDQLIDHRPQSTHLGLLMTRGIPFAVSESRTTITIIFIRCLSTCYTSSTIIYMYFPHSSHNGLAPKMFIKSFEECGWLQAECISKYLSNNDKAPSRNTKNKIKLI